MAGQRKIEQKKTWEDKGTAACQEAPRVADQVLDKVKQASAAKNKLKGTVS